jgi:hypothetical protein
VVTQREYRSTEQGEARVWDARYLPLAAPGQAPDQLLMVATDVTEQRAAEQAKFDAAIAQREMLVKEVHHRIKNNLQGVAGLLQQIGTRKPEVAERRCPRWSGRCRRSPRSTACRSACGPLHVTERGRSDRQLGATHVRAPDPLRVEGRACRPMGAARGRVDSDRADPQRTADQRRSSTA